MYHFCHPSYHRDDASSLLGRVQPGRPRSHALCSLAPGPWPPCPWVPTQDVGVEALACGVAHCVSRASESQPTRGRVNKSVGARRRRRRSVSRVRTRAVLGWSPVSSRRVENGRGTALACSSTSHGQFLAALPFSASSSALSEREGTTANIWIGVHSRRTWL